MKIYLSIVMSLFFINVSNAATAEISKDMIEEVQSLNNEAKDIFIEASFQNSGGLVTGATIGWAVFKYFHIASRVYIPISYTNDDAYQRLELVGRIPFLHRPKGNLYLEGFLGESVYRRVSAGSAGAALGFNYRISRISDLYFGGQAGFNYDQGGEAINSITPKMELNLGLKF